MPAIWWIRRDLRLTDNAALHAACKMGSVIPLFILDPAFSRSSPRRKNFLYEGLHALDKDLRLHNSYLIIRDGRPVDVLRQLLDDTNARAIYAEEDFTPYALKRDEEVARVVVLESRFWECVEAGTPPADGSNSAAKALRHLFEATTPAWISPAILGCAGSSTYWPHSEPSWMP